MELTRIFTKDELLNMRSFYERNDCSRRTAREFIDALLADMDKPKVSEHAPDWADQCDMEFRKKGVVSGMPYFGRTEFRTLPKSPEREIAEIIVDMTLSFVTSSQKKEELIDEAIKKINEYKESVK